MKRHGIIIPGLLVIAASVATGCESARARQPASSALAGPIGKDARPLHEFTEIRIGWLVSASSSQRPIQPPPSVAWCKSPPLPDDAMAAIVRFRDAVAAAPIEHRALLTSDDGRRALLFRYDPFRSADARDPAPGVIVWPDWRESDRTLVFADMAKARFLSSHHMVLSHHPPDGPWISAIVDLRRPEVRFRLPGYQLNTLRLTDDGRWACIATDGRLFAGRLDPVDPERSVVGALVPIEPSVRNLIWVDGGRLLVVQREGARLDALDASTWAVASSIDGTLGPESGEATALGARAILGWQAGVGAVVFDLSPTGMMTAAQWPHQVQGESVVRLSPSGRFVVTQPRSKFFGAPRFCRRTPLAGTADEPPEIGRLDAGTSFQDIGWLVSP